MLSILYSVCIYRPMLKQIQIEDTYICTLFPTDFSCRVVSLSALALKVDSPYSYNPFFFSTARLRSVTVI